MRSRLRAVQLSARRLRYWRDEKGHTKDPDGTLKGEIELSALVDVVSPSSCPKMKDSMVRRSPFDVIFNLADGEVRTMTLCGSTHEESVLWYSQVRRAFLAHPAVLRAKHVVPPVVVPVQPRAPGERPTDYDLRVICPDVVREVGSGDTVTSVFADSETLLCGFGRRGLHLWNERRNALEPVEQGSGICVVIARGRQDPSLIIAAFKADSGTANDSIRHWNQRQGSAPVFVGEMQLSSCGERVSSILLNEPRSLLLASIGEQIEVWSYVSHGLLQTLYLDAICSVIGSHGELMYTVSADECEGGIQVWSMSTLLFENTLSEHDRRARFGAQSLAAISETRLVSVASDCAVILWDLTEMCAYRRGMHRAAPGDKPLCVLLSRRKNLLMTGGGYAVNLWSADELEPMGGFDLSLPSVCFAISCDGAHVFAMSGHAILLYGLESDSQAMLAITTDDDRALPERTPSPIAPAVLLALTANSLFYFERRTPRLFEVCFIDEKIRSAERTLSSVRGAGRRYRDSVAEYEASMALFREHSDAHAIFHELYELHLQPAASASGAPTNPATGAAPAVASGTALSSA